MCSHLPLPFQFLKISKEFSIYLLIAYFIGTVGNEFLYSTDVVKMVCVTQKGHNSGVSWLFGAEAS